LLSLDKISKHYEDFSLKEVSFTVQKGDYFILLGRSGAGKSMVLETIAGLITPDSGSIRMDGRDITRDKIQTREIGLVFQDHAIFPHMKVRENLAYALHRGKYTASQKEEKVKAVSEQLGFGHLLGRRPPTLSGGELQRVALARTLIQEPKILLLDEPLASIDSRMKSGLRSLLRSIHRKGQTLIHVTHDYEEALSLATRVAVIDDGMIVQEGNPQEVFRHPRSEFVAHFAGLQNFFPVTLENREGQTLARTGGPAIRLRTEESCPEGFIIIRGEDIVLSPGPVDTSMINNFQGTITEIIPSRSGFEVTVDAGIRLYAVVTEESAARLSLGEGQKIWVHFKASAVRFIPR